MKKVLLSVVALALVAGFSSCKKDRTCDCKNSTTSFKYEWKKVKKKDAQEACDALNTLWSIGGGSCTLN